jgi:hypothetical protein
MPDQLSVLSSSDSKPSKVDTAASAACVRSGAFALLLAVALLLMIPYWKDLPKYNALSAYLTYRLNLASSVESLDDDPIWREYKTANDGAESLSIAQLRDLSVDITNMRGIQVKPQQVPPTPPKPRPKAATTGPQPPTGLAGHIKLASGVPEASRIAESLLKLNDFDTLTLTRQVSNYFNFQVVRWANKRGALAYRNVMTIGPCTKKEMEVPHRGSKPPEFVPSLTEEALLGCLTIGNVRELAQYEEPTVTNPMELGGRVMPAIEILPGALPRGSVDPYTGTFAVEVLLFFVIMYFGAFAREAVSSSAFPAPGTIFGAFSKSRWTLLVLLIAVYAPLGASLTLLAVTRKGMAVVCTLLISGAVLSAHTVLAGKAYFHALDPRLLLPRKHRPNKAPATSTSSAA